LNIASGVYPPGSQIPAEQQYSMLRKRSSTSMCLILLNYEREDCIEVNDHAGDKAIWR
jgi:hypothetical protein